MIIIIILLSIVCVFYIFRLLLLKRTIRQLTSDFKVSRKNIRGEQHVQMLSPDKDLELLAKECNLYVKEYFEEHYRHEKEISSIRNEITNLSHDLRTPITSIMGYIDLMEEEKLSDEQAENLKVVKRRSEDLNSLIEQLYDYVRLENRDIMIQMQRVDMFRTLREHLLSFYDEFERKGIELTIDFPETEEGVWIWGNTNCLERVLSNMTSNMIKYSEGQAKVALQCETEQVSVTYQSPRGDLSDSDITQVFERFYKKDMARGGTRSSGLGLTIAKLYVEQMNGKVSAWGDKKNLYIRFSFPRKK
ncbi:sensor histidine kinase [Anaeromicropila populeti]|uniref:histidine kinase n=1 Tax=Anaeromicropila populeti TaxID=37658 RepID=A0A1I6K961_9FIRM|nr:HAMP domain-containing sensor histidine kinase [Anaeromicropila populeti]SFR87737.1 Signal transduction histidine kinase [Anaeromicropila populeti]